MKIVQSFWSCKKSLLQYSFGWLSPQYHVMGWALSCLKLKEHYEDLHLYTDTAGYSILIEYLNLPYKTAQISYDDMDDYNDLFWATAKIITYSLQDKPFIHVDGDVFVWERFAPEIEKAPLIAQNLETGTAYYKSAMEGIGKQITYIPEYLKEEIEKESISAYNAGIIGGSDIGFYKKYVQEALKIINDNFQNTGSNGQVSSDFNILFEQILFYALSEKENKAVTCYFKQPYNDNGYSAKEFADFTTVPYGSKYLHLIGNKKRNHIVCELMSQVLFRDYPEYYFKIITLFSSTHLKFDTHIQSVIPSFLQAHNLTESKSQPGNVPKSQTYIRTQEAIRLQDNNGNEPYINADVKTFVKDFGSKTTKLVYQYEDQLYTYLKKWQSIPPDRLYLMELSACDYFSFFYHTKEQQLNTLLIKNSFLEIAEDSFEWPDETKDLINKYIGAKSFSESNGIACVPTLFFKGYKEVIIDELDYNILAMLNGPIKLIKLLNRLEVCFTPEETEDNFAAVYELILDKLKQLFINRCIFIQLNSNGPEQIN